jgi:hypothetical protein
LNLNVFVLEDKPDLVRVSESVNNGFGNRALRAMYIVVTHTYLKLGGKQEIQLRLDASLNKKERHAIVAVWQTILYLSSRTCGRMSVLAASLSGMSERLSSKHDGHFSATSRSIVALQKQDWHSANCSDCLRGSTTVELTVCMVTLFGAALLSIANKQHVGHLRLCWPTGSILDSLLSFDEECRGVRLTAPTPAFPAHPKAGLGQQPQTPALVFL